MARARLFSSNLLDLLFSSRHTMASAGLAIRCAAPLRKQGVWALHHAIRTMATSAVKRENAKTGLYDFHVRNKGKMVPFGGYAMPLTYGDVGQMASHRHVRNACGLFDVGHMVQHTFTGPGSAAFLESLCPTSLKTLEPYSSTLSVLLNDQGGIIDDLIVSKQADEQTWYVVTNAGCREKDLKHLDARLRAWNGDEVSHVVLDDYGLVALQGPQAAEVLAKHTEADLSRLTFGKSVRATVAGAECHIARAGYTGEDGFEISIPPQQTEAVTQALLDTAPTQLAGLAARDSLRLEAGMCLYGHDLDDSTSPIEGGLAWLVSKNRREQKDFPGAERILSELSKDKGPVRRRVGLLIEGAPAREGAQILAEDGRTPLGTITSGIPSPTLGQNIAMGYVLNGHHKKGTSVLVDVRRKLRAAKVVGMPFVPSKFYRG
jgi:aminomethyltransferase